MLILLVATKDILAVKADTIIHLMSISPIFYEQLFRTKVFSAAFMCLQFGFVIFWQKNFGAKAAHKMLLKLTPGLFVITTIALVLLKWIFCELTCPGSLLFLDAYG
jgi:hypothetical protein